MRARGNSVRFVMVSATVPNIDDVANWIGDGVFSGPATVKEVWVLYVSEDELLTVSPSSAKSSGRVNSLALYTDIKGRRI